MERYQAQKDTYQQLLKKGEHYEFLIGEHFKKEEKDKEGLLRAKDKFIFETRPEKACKLELVENDTLNQNV